MKRLIFLLTLLATSWPAPGSAQPPPSTEQMVAVDPIRCWWRTSKGAVRIGETFDLSMTCAVLENDAVQVIPDESRLAGAVVAMAPYEVVASQHAEDLHSGQRRFFQYQYTMRIINPDAIGSDVPIPIMSLHYRINSKIAENASVQGRDLTYVLPPHTVRVLSLVSADAPDIRDSSDESFSIIESLRLRAGTLEVLAVTLAALGALMIIIVLVRLAAGFRKGAVEGKRAMGSYRVLSRAARELASVQRDVDQGWNETLAGRALAATRIAASTALGRSVSQRPVAGTSEAGDGRVIMRGLLNRGKATALSSGATPEDVARAINRLPTAANPSHRQMLEDLQAALATFGKAQYGREAAADRTALDAALASAVSATRRLRTEHIWPRPQLRKWTARPAALEHRA
jgi:hypothetical protein